MAKCRHFLYGVVAVLLVLTLTVTACAPGPTPTPDKTPASAPVPAPAPAATITRDQAYIMVIERLTNLAQTSEANEYLTIFLVDSASWREYDDGLGAWVVGISPGPEGYNLIKKADWFNVADVAYFFDVHWDEPRPAWLVYDDDKIVPLGKAPMVEADIEQLNTTRTLK